MTVTTGAASRSARGACERASAAWRRSLAGELRDGRRFVLGPGVSYQVSDHDGAHRSSTTAGARLFVVD